ncbi:hypothetical protein [Dictyobacter arantiisoli]|uniref:Uncharacterized protein n=1 Tax=Dictyobacter arantiisoli TaxID=2014874 RepID=A0A5A5TBK7_9CHLR|nr:hypothetical protein [Dictyobacter arantiisoli]GCF08812.1 hypothetical protein KDI_23760 [Dictyobacter arantiisoli]
MDILEATFLEVEVQEMQSPAQISEVHPDFSSLHAYNERII